MSSHTLLERSPAPGLSVQPALPTHVYWLSGMAAVTMAVAASLTFFLPHLLAGPAVTNGNARGTALVMMALGIPGLALAMVRQRAGSWRALVVWLGFIAYLLYNSFLFVFATPVNRLFLIYLAGFSLTLFGTIALVRAADSLALYDRLERLPARGLAVYVWLLVGLNTLTWLRAILPALAGDPAALAEGTDLGTNPVYVQDLTFWLPLMAVSAWYLWRRFPWAILVTGGWLVYGVVESIGVAVDQWFGHQADPTSPLAAMGAVVLFAVMAVVGLIPLYFYFRTRPTRPARTKHPAFPTVSRTGPTLDGFSHER